MMSKFSNFQMVTEPCRSIFKFSNYTLLFLLIFVSCSKEKICNCLTPRGKTDQEERILAKYNTIIVYNNFNIYLVRDTAHKVKISGGKNLLSSVTTTVTNDTLEIRNKNVCNWLKNFPVIDIYLNENSFQHINIFGPCNISTVDTFKTSFLAFYMETDLSTANLTVNCDDYFFFGAGNNSGQHTINGFAKASQIFSKGTSVIHAENLVSKATTVNTSSTGNCYISVLNQLNVNISGNGNVYYKGTPPIIVLKNENAKGKLINIAP